MALVFKMKGPSSALHSHESPDWYTPATIVDAARTVMGSIDLDPCTDFEAQKTVKATRYYLPPEDGLLHPWEGNVFINPPGGQVNVFWKKLMDSCVDQFLWVGYSLEQLQTLQNVSDVIPQSKQFSMCIPKHRIAFVENAAKREIRRKKFLQKNDFFGFNSGKKFGDAVSPTHANYLTYGGPNKQKFVDVFLKFGWCRL